MVLQFNYLRVTTEKQESQKGETTEQSTERQRQCCSTGRSGKSKEKMIQVFLVEMQLAQHFRRPREFITMTQTSIGWYESILKM